MTDILWIRPPVPDNVSPGRRRIADELEARGYSITLEGTDLGHVRRAGEYDVVIGTSHSGAIVGALAATRHRVPFVLDHVDSIVQLYKTNPVWQALPAQIAETWAMHQADATLFVTREDMDRLDRHADPYAETRLGVPYDRFSPPMEYDTPDGWPGNPAAIYTGTLSETYNVRAMCEGAAAADVELVVLGEGPLSEYVADHPAVTYPGSVPHEQVPAWLWSADVGLSLVDDAHTVKVLEYAAAGLPVVQLEGDATRYYRDMVTYTDGDPVDVAKAIHRARLDPADPDLRVFAKKHTYSRVGDDYEWAIERALQQRG
jgi:glycosyltransferase involved in cell wall biosynthesis